MLATDDDGKVGPSDAISNLLPPIALKGFMHRPISDPERGIRVLCLTYQCIPKLLVMVEVKADERSLHDHRPLPP